jgi:4-amino-4-deoxy-L-arabinose transferase-like glycosyltransferase
MDGRGQKPKWNKVDVTIQGHGMKKTAGAFVFMGSAPQGVLPVSRPAGQATDKTGPYVFTDTVSAAPPPFRRTTLLALLGVFSLSLTLDLIGITACLPNACMWCNDTIAGMNTVYQRSRLFSTWTNKYPRIHFLVNSAAYEPFLRYWQRHPVLVADAQGRQGPSSLNLDRASTLSLVAFIITALMGAGAVAAVFFAARLLFESDLAAFLAAMAMACIHEFIFYAHTGNTDVPAAFWFAWCVYWAARVIRFGMVRDYVLLAIFAVLAVGTKDPTIGFLVGLSLLVAARHIFAARAAGRPWFKALPACINRRTMLALALFIFGFALVNNIITNPQGYLHRMSYWQGPDITNWSNRPGLVTHIQLIAGTVLDLYFAMGWPLLALAAASLVYGFIRMPRKTIFCILPLLTFQLIVVSHIRFTIPRFFMPGYIGLALIAGAGAAALLGNRRLLVAGALSLIFVYATTFCYGLGSSLEIARDSRVRTVEWFTAHADTKAFVAALIPPWYGPYLPKAGFDNYAYPWTPPPLDQPTQPASMPNYIITGVYHQIAPAARPFYQAMLDGKLPYEKAASFEQMYFYPKKTIFGFAGWPITRLRQSSPPIIIWERKTP